MKTILCLSLIFSMPVFAQTSEQKERKALSLAEIFTDGVDIKRPSYRFSEDRKRVIFEDCLPSLQDCSPIGQPEGYSYEDMQLMTTVIGDEFQSVESTEAMIKAAIVLAGTVISLGGYLALTAGLADDGIAAASLIEAGIITFAGYLGGQAVGWVAGKGYTVYMEASTLEAELAILASISKQQQAPQSPRVMISEGWESFRENLVKLLEKVERFSHNKGQVSEEIELINSP